MTVDKKQVELEQLIHILHHGIGLQDASVKGSFKIIGKKLAGDIPLGSEAATFVTRKRMMLMSLQMQMLVSVMQSILSLLLLVVMLLMVWATYPQTEWFLLAVTIGLILWLVYSGKQARASWKLIKIIKPIEQIHADPKRKVETQRVQNLAGQASQFAKPRLMTRLIGTVIIIMSGFSLYQLYLDPPQYWFRLYFILPFLFMLGIGLVVYPINKQENLHLYGVTQMSIKDMPWGVKLCLLIGAGLSVAMLLAFEMGLDVFSYINNILG